MRRYFIIFFLVFSLVLSPFDFGYFFSAPPVSAGDIVIDTDTEWSGVQTISGYAEVTYGRTLTIKPGTIVEFDGLSSLDIRGTLRAEGTPNDPIIFRKKNPTNANDHYSIMVFGSLYARNIDVSGGGSAFETFFVQKEKRNFPVQYANAMWLYSGAFTAYDRGKIDIEGANFHDNALAVYIAQSSFPAIKVSYSKFVHNTLDVVSETSFLPPDVRHNWWNNVNGPEACSIDCGDSFPRPYQKIIGRTNFIPWLDNSADAHASDGACTENCFSNVLFLPGLEASRLYVQDDPDCLFLNCENQLWEPNRNDDGEKLFLDDNGKSINPDVYTKDVLDEVNVSKIGQKNIYKSFLADLDKWKNEEKIIVDYSAIPYDWRLSLEDILAGGAVDGEKIFYTEKSIAPYIVRELRRLASTSKTGKVTIIAHSNGGLVAKALTNMLGSEAEKLIDDIVLVAVPQIGTPQSIGAILHGYDQGLPTDFLSLILTQKTARTLAQNMQSAYNLLPSKSYFGGNGSTTSTPVISFRDGLLTDPFIKKYGNEISTEEALRSFLLDSEGKVSADADDVIRPSRVNAKLLNLAQSVHEALDDTFTVPASIAVYQIAGFGEETLGTIKYFTGESCTKSFRGWCLASGPKLEYSPEMVIDGDGTVVAPSALSMDTKRYWVDLKRYDTFANIKRKHADIFEVPDIRTFIKDIVIKHLSSNLPKYLSDSVPFIASEKRLQYILHSPLTLSVRDTAGNEISASVSTISGATYRRFGEVQYISLPASTAHTVILDGLAEGSFTLEMREVENGIAIAETAFSGIPNSAETTATLEVTDGTITGASPLIIDTDGDGASDFFLQPKVGEKVMLPPLDETPPEVKLFFDTRTNQMGVDIIDESRTTTTYTTIPIESKKDRKEEKREEQKEKQQKKVMTVTDRAGNSTVLTYTEKFTENNQKLTFELDSICYNGVTTSFENTKAEYHFRQTKKGVSQYVSFATDIHTASRTLKSYYIPKQDITIIIDKLRESDDEDDDQEDNHTKQKLSGMSIPTLVTHQGNIEIEY